MKVFLSLIQYLKLGVELDEYDWQGGNQLAITTPLDQRITLEKFLKLPESEPASEFIKGRIYQKPMPQGKHSRLQLKLCDAVNQVAEESQIALAFPGLRCTFGGRSIVPDGTIFTWGRIPFDAEG